MGQETWTRGYDWINWRPLEDPDKPELPYRPGFRLSIRRHVPPSPFGRRYTGKEPARSDADYEEQHLMRLTDWSLRNPPTETPPHPDPAVCGLEVLDALACKDGRGAQIVRCRLDTDPERICVAKIYDPFYYSYLSEFSGASDVTWLADHDYSREATAYEALRDAQVDGQLVPKYYGSWTFDLPVPEALRLSCSVPGPPVMARPVRMVLIGWFPGVSIDTLLRDEKTVKSIPPALRLEVLAQAMEIFCKLEHHGVRHNDFAPRNILVSPASGWTMQSLPTVIMVDFNRADITVSPYCKATPADTPSLPPNPRYRFWGNTMLEFPGWVPKLLGEGGAINGWMSTRWREDEPGFGNPPPKQKEHFDTSPYIVNKIVPLEDSPLRSPRRAYFWPFEDTPPKWKGSGYIS